MHAPYLIIGSSAAGLSVVKKIRQLDAHAQIVCISDEQETPYNKCLLADYLGNVLEEDRVHTVRGDYACDLGVTFLLGTRVQQLVPQEKAVQCSNGQRIAYDRLFIGTGTKPYMPAIEGITEFGNIFTFHTLADTNAVRAALAQHTIKQAVVIGAGLTGLEAAYALRAHNVTVTVVERAAQLLNNQVDAQASVLIERCMAQHETTFMANASVVRVHGDHGLVTGVTLSDGTQLPAQMVIVAAGSQPDTALLHGAGIEQQHGGIVVDEYMQTSVADIFAGGDVALVKEQLTGAVVRSCTWPDAMLQGSYAAQAMVGQPRAYPGVTLVTSSAFFGIKFVTCGPVVTPPSVYDVVVQQGADFYHKFIMHNGILKGFLLVGRVTNLTQLKRAVLTQTPIDPEIFSHHAE